jgi:hypothetical protein
MIHADWIAELRDAWDQRRYPQDDDVHDFTDREVSGYTEVFRSVSSPDDAFRFQWLTKHPPMLERQLAFIVDP